MKILNIPMKLVLIISLVLVVLLTSLFFTSKDIDFFRDKFYENNTMELTSKSEDELIDISEKLIEYLYTGEEELLKPQFNEREILHMVDVYELFNLAKKCQTSELCTINYKHSIYIENWIEKFFKTLLSGLAIFIVFIAGIGVFIFSNFNSSFTMFHELLFTNDLWLLDPETDLMIQMLPENFFMDMALQIGIYFIVSLLIIAVVSAVYLTLTKEDDTK